MEENGSPVPLLPPGLLFTLRTVQCNVASERLDAVAAQVFRLSRGGELPELLRSGKVFINGRTVFDAGRVLKYGDIVSVRGCGRFVYRGIERETKKSRFFVKTEIYS